MCVKIILSTKLNCCSRFPFRVDTTIFRAVGVKCFKAVSAEDLREVVKIKMSHVSRSRAIKRFNSQDMLCPVLFSPEQILVAVKRLEKEEEEFCGWKWRPPSVALEATRQRRVAEDGRWWSGPSSPLASPTHSPQVHHCHLQRDWGDLRCDQEPCVQDLFHHVSMCMYGGGEPRAKNQTCQTSLNSWRSAHQDDL